MALAIAAGIFLISNALFLFRLMPVTVSARTALIMIDAIKPFAMQGGGMWAWIKSILFLFRKDSGFPYES